MQSSKLHKLKDSKSIRSHKHDRSTSSLPTITEITEERPRHTTPKHTFRRTDFFDPLSGLGSGEDNSLQHISDDNLSKKQNSQSVKSNTGTVVPAVNVIQETSDESKSAHSEKSAKRSDSSSDHAVQVKAISEVGEVTEESSSDQSDHSISAT